MANAMGKIKPLAMPANNNNCLGFPMKTKMQVERIMNIEMQSLSYLMNNGWNFLKKETEVYAAPTTEEIAALHNTTPKMRRPKFPAAV